MKKKNKNLYLTIFTFLASFIIIDFLLGVFYTPRVDHYRQPHDFYHHELVPNLSNLTINWGPYYYKISTNSLGFRDSEPRVIKKKSEKHRILLMGDSFTEGLGVSWKDSFAGIIQNGLMHKNIDVLNAGTIGYSPKLYLLKTDYLINYQNIKIDQLLVFIDRSDIDNEHLYEDYNSNSKSIYASLLQKLSKNSFFLGKMRQPTQLNYNNQGVPFSLNLKKNYKPIKGDWSVDNKKVEKGFNLATKNILNLLKICKENNIKMTIIIYPWQRDIGKKNLQERVWRGFSIKNNINLISLFNIFDDVCKKNGQNCKNLFIPSDVHWSPKGHEIVANELLKYLNKDF